MCYSGLKKKVPKIIQIKKISALRFSSCIISKITANKTLPRFIKIYESHGVIVLFQIEASYFKYSKHFLFVEYIDIINR